MPFKIVTIGLRQAQQLLGELQLVMSAVNRNDLIAMKNIGIADVDQHFEDQGPGWKGRKASTMRRIAFNSRASEPRDDVAKVGDKLLQTSKAHLRKGVKGKLNPTGFTVDNKIPYAQVQNAEREFMWFSDIAINKMIDIPFQRLAKIRTK